MNIKDTLFSIKQTVNCGGRLLSLKEPLVAGILNLTPDSFYDGGRHKNESDVMQHVAQMIEEGADIIDIGAYSSRPHAKHITEEEEMSRLVPALTGIRRLFPDVIISVDTFRSGIVQKVVRDFKVQIVNDISAGIMDMNMMSVVASLGVPYIMMHMKGTPSTMQSNPVYNDVVKEILSFFAERIQQAKYAGIEDIILDPGFGFGKKRSHNYTLLRELRVFEILGFPVMVGVSHKSMVYQPLDISVHEALNGTTVLNTMALINGANILRVHDVKEAKQAIKLFQMYQNPEN
jgi:dihydropteroate synthase